MIDRLRTFLKESREEFSHVNWPTRQEALYLTATVIGFSLLIAVFLGVSDSFFVYLLRSFVL